MVKNMMVILKSSQVKKSRSCCSFSESRSFSVSGFTLVELSIVIVIIGLIVAGITVGNSLVKQARLRTTINYVQQIQSAFTQFKYRYDAIPGDMKIASSYWPGVPNGNGNGNYDTWDVYNNGESYAAWNHLANAQMINGSFTGLQGSGSIKGSNVPMISLVNNDSLFFYYGNVSNQYSNQNALIMQGISGIGTNTDIPVLYSYAMDDKIDDGKPFIGRVISYGANSSGLCTSIDMLVAFPAAMSSAQKQSSQYKVGSPSDGCATMFSIGQTIWK